MALSLRALPENSIIVGSNSSAIAAQCQRSRGRTVGNYGTIRNDSAVPVAGVEGGEGEGEEEVPEGEARRASEPQVLQHHQGEDDRSIIEMYEMYEMSGHQEEEDDVGETEHSEQQGGEDRSSIAQTGNDEEEQDERRGNRYHSRLGGPSGSNFAHVQDTWVGKVQWGVFVLVSTDVKDPGQLGMSAPMDIKGTPTNGHYYQ